MTNPYEEALNCRYNSPAIIKALTEIKDLFPTEESQAFDNLDWLYFAISYAIRSGYLKGVIRLERYYDEQGRKVINLYDVNNWIEPDQKPDLDQNPTVSIRLALKNQLWTDLFPHDDGYCPRAELNDIQTLQLVLAIANKIIANRQKSFSYFWNNPSDFLLEFQPQLKIISPGLEIQVPELSSTLKIK